MGSMQDATELSIGAAKHLTDMDMGAVEALRVLATKIDTDDEIRELFLANAGEGVKLQLDNVSLPTYLKYCEALGLTPAARKVSSKKGAAADEERTGIARRRQSATLLRPA